jgi:branched-chain amino acid transport system substrate-binding protein
MIKARAGALLAMGTAAILFLSACSSSGGTSGGGGTTGSGGSAGSGSTASLEFPIGIVTSLTAGDDQLGKEASEAIQKFVAWNNSSKTGVTFKIVGTQDDKGDPPTGRQAATELVSQGAKAIVGDMSSAVAEATEPVVLASNAIYMVSGSWADDLTGPSKPLAYRVGAWNSGLAKDGIEPYLEHLAKTSNLTSVGLLTEDSPYGTGAAQQMIKLANQNLPNVKMYNAQYPANSTDVTGQLLQLKSKNPQLIIVSAIGAARNLAIKQAREAGITAPILAQWNWPTYSDYWKVVGDAGVGIQYVDFDAPHRASTSMSTTMQQQIGHAPSIWAQWAWDGMLALRAAILAAKSTDTTAVATAMANVSFTGASGDIAFDTTGDNFHNRKSLPAYVLQLNKKNDGAADAKVIFTPTNQ